MKKKTLFSLAVIFFLTGVTGYAEVCHYTDSRGEVHFVNDDSDVPEQYRGQVKKIGSLPELNVVGRPDRFLTDSSPAASESRSFDQPQRKESFKGNVEVFITSWCGYCKKLESFLKEQGIAYTAYDIEKDRGADKTYKELGGRGVPVSRIGSTVVRGYNPEAILKAIAQER